MSLVSLALRLVTARMLAGQTWAESHIFDSPVDPIDAATSGGVLPDAPWLAIYTGDVTTQIPGKQTQGAEHSIDLMIYSYLPPADFAIDGGLTISARTEGGAAALDILGRQIEAALRFGAQPWTDIWQRLVVSIESSKSRPVLIELEKGPTIQCREVVYTINTVPDPNFGVPLYGGWAMLKDAMDGDAASAPIAGLFAALIAGPADLPSWQQAEAMLGASYAAVRAAGLTPQGETETGEPHVLAGIVLEQGTVP